jgi:hypothetical protein
MVISLFEELKFRNSLYDSLEGFFFFFLFIIKGINYYFFKKN